MVTKLIYKLSFLRGLIGDVDREDRAPGRSLDEDGGGRGGERRGERHRQEVVAAQRMPARSNTISVFLKMPILMQKL